MVLLQVTPGTFEFQLLFIMTMLIIATKAICLIFVGKKLLDKRKEGEAIGLSFVFGIFILLLCLLISRLIYVYFDFILTEFDASRYYKFPNYIFWKLGTMAAAIGVGFLLFVADKRVLKFRLKGLVSLIPIIGAIIILIYPVSNSDDFAFISGLSIVTYGAIAILLIFFIYVAIKSPGEVRRNAILIVLGGILYFIGALLVNEALLTQLRLIFGEEIHILVFFLFMAFKISGLISMSYAFTKFAA
jgi:hypothetical protein